MADFDYYDKRTDKLVVEFNRIKLYIDNSEKEGGISPDEAEKLNKKLADLFNFPTKTFRVLVRYFDGRRVLETHMNVQARNPGEAEEKAKNCLVVDARIVE
jgi:hypothetical protein